MAAYGAAVKVAAWDQLHCAVSGRRRLCPGRLHAGGDPLFWKRSDRSVSDRFQYEVARPELRVVRAHQALCLARGLGLGSEGRRDVPSGVVACPSPLKSPIN